VTVAEIKFPQMLQGLQERKIRLKRGAGTTIESVEMFKEEACKWKLSSNNEWAELNFLGCQTERGGTTKKKKSTVGPLTKQLTNGKNQQKGGGWVEIGGVSKVLIQAGSTQP